MCPGQKAAAEHRKNHDALNHNRTPSFRSGCGFLQSFQQAHVVPAPDTVTLVSDFIHLLWSYDDLPAYQPVCLNLICTVAFDFENDRRAGDPP